MKVIEEPDMKNGFYKEGIGDAATIVVGEKIYCIGSSENCMIWFVRGRISSS